MKARAFDDVIFWCNTASSRRGGQSWVERERTMDDKAKCAANFLLIA